MSFQIKISGIDENADKHMWIDINSDGLDLNEECEYIRRNPNKKNKIEESNKIMEELENKIKNLSINKPPLKKRKKEEEIEEIENKIEVLSLEEKPKYKLNKDRRKY